MDIETVKMLARNLPDAGLAVFDAPELRGTQIAEFTYVMEPTIERAATLTLVGGDRRWVLELNARETSDLIFDMGAIQRAKSTKPVPVA